MKRLSKQKIIMGVSAVIVGVLLLTACAGKHKFTVYADGDYISPTLIEAFTRETGIKVNYVIGDKTPEVFEETLFEDSSTQTVESAITNALSDGAGEATAHDPADGLTNGSADSSTAETTEGELFTELAVPHEQALQKAQEKAEAKGDTSFDEATVKYPAAAYDVILTDGNELGELAEQGLLLPLDKEQVTALSTIDDEYKGLSYDPENKYTVTTMWQYMGLLVNTNLVDQQIKTWDALWDEQWKGKILMPDDMEKCVALSLLASGESVMTTDEETIRKAFDRLEEQKPLVGAYTNRDAYILMENDRAALYPCTSSTAVQMISENPNLIFIVPQVSSGSYQQNTDMEYIHKGITFRTSLGYAVAADSIYSDEAQQFINYMCTVENQAKNAVYAKYASTSEKTLKKLDDSWSTNPILYPNETILEDTELLTHRTGDIWTECQTRWKALTKQSDTTVMVEITAADAS